MAPVERPLKFLGQRLALRAALVVAPRAEWARFHLGNAYAEHGFPERALEHWAIACDRPTARAAALQNLGSALMALDRPGEAIAPLARVAALRPEDADLHALLGRAHQKAKDAAGAAQAYERALALAPGRDELRLTVGLLRLSLKDEVAALAHLRALRDPALVAKVAPKVAALAKKLEGP